MALQCLPFYFIFFALIAFQATGSGFFLSTSMALDLQADALTSGAARQHVEQRVAQGH